LPGASAAKSPAVNLHFAFEVNPFTALGTDHARTLKAGQIFRKDFDLHPFFGEENLVGKLCVSFLLAFFSGEVGKHIFGGQLGGFFGSNANSAAGLQVAERGGYFPPIAELQGTLAQATVGNQGDRIGNAAIDFYVGDNTFALGDGITDAEFTKTEHGEADTEDLSGTDVAMDDRSKLEVFSEGFHSAAVLAPVILMASSMDAQTMPGRSTIRRRSQR
jgi:hypothetical protein